jgi:hypothetical protein
MVVKMVVRPIAKLSEEGPYQECPSHRPSMLRRRAFRPFFAAIWQQTLSAMQCLDAAFKAPLRLDQLQESPTRD